MRWAEYTVMNMMKFNVFGKYLNDLEVLALRGVLMTKNDAVGRNDFKHDNSKIFTFLYSLCQCIIWYGQYSYTLVSDILIDEKF